MMVNNPSDVARFDAKLKRIHAALVIIRNVSRRALLTEGITNRLYKDLVEIENLADLSESLITSNDAEILTLIDSHLK